MSDDTYPVELEFRDWMRVMHALGFTEGDWRKRDCVGEANRYDNLQTKITEQLKE